MTKKKKKFASNKSIFVCHTKHNWSDEKNKCRTIEKGMKLNVDDDDRVFVTRLRFWNHELLRKFFFAEKCGKNEEKNFSSCKMNLPWLLIIAVNDQFFFRLLNDNKQSVLRAIERLWWPLNYTVYFYDSVLAVVICFSFSLFSFFRRLYLWEIVHLMKRSWFNNKNTLKTLHRVIDSVNCVMFLLDFHQNNILISYIFAAWMNEVNRNRCFQLCQ